MMKFLSMAMAVMEKFRTRYLVDAVLGDDEVSVDGDGGDGEGGHEDTQVGQGLHQPEKRESSV
jgi:hypothetical protein